MPERMTTDEKAAAFEDWAQAALVHHDICSAGADNPQSMMVRRSHDTFREAMDRLWKSAMRFVAEE